MTRSTRWAHRTIQPWRRIKSLKINFGGINKMAGTIIKKLKKMAADVALDEPAEGEEPLGEKLAWMAVDALLLGPNSQQWKDYMMTFGPSEKELLRLTLKDDKKDDK